MIVKLLCKIFGHTHFYKTPNYITPPGNWGRMYMGYVARCECCGELTMVDDDERLPELLPKKEIREWSETDIRLQQGLDNW